MFTPGQLRGMLLEEALLYLLRATGYRTVGTAGNDPTLKNGSAGLNVLGRGAVHQIDAIADFMVQHPFSNPQRLLIEAKCLKPGERVGLPVIRNALGVLRDVSEYWVSRGRGHHARTQIPKPRFHYQYAVFSATGYSAHAESFAFAQDIYLIPLQNSRYVQPIIQNIRDAAEAIHEAVRNDDTKIRLSLIRQFVRRDLQGISASTAGLPVPQYIRAALQGPLDACQAMEGVMLATLGGRFPVFLVPAAGIQIGHLQNTLEVRITWDDDGWYINGSYDSGPPQPLFSFDLPENLFKLYAEGDHLSLSRAIDLKEHMMSDFQAVRWNRGRLEIIQFVLDHDWLRTMRERIGGE